MVRERLSKVRGGVVRERLSKVRRCGEGEKWSKVRGVWWEKSG